MTIDQPDRGIDARGRHAADRLRRSVASQVDSDRTWIALQGSPAAPGGRAQAPGRWQRPLVGVAAVLILGLAVAGAVVAQQGDRSRPEAGRDPRERIGLQLPSSPIDGKQSWRLPVVAAPQSGLHDGQTISVVGRGFEPGEQVAVVMCSSEADTENAGVKGCALGTGGSFQYVLGYANADVEGIAFTDVTVPRFIETGGFGRVDCQSAAERCLVGMGEVSNYDRSGGSYLLFDGSPPFPEVSAAAAPTQNLVPGTSVVVSVKGSMPRRNIAIYQCRNERCALRIVTRGSAEGNAVAGVAVYTSVRDDRGEVACDGECTIEIRGYGGPPGATSAPQPDPIPISFDPDAPAVATPPPTTVAPTTTAVPTEPGVPGNPGPPTTYVIPVPGGTLILPNGPVTDPAPSPSSVPSTTEPPSTATTEAPIPQGPTTTLP